MDLLQRLFYTAIGTLSFVIFFIKFTQSHWKTRGILHEKPKFFWGNLKGVGTKRCLPLVINEIYRKYKNKAPFIGFYALMKPMVLVLDMELVKQILITKAENFEIRGLYNNPTGDILSYNLMQLDDDDEWQRLRTTMQPIFEKEIIIGRLGETLLRVTDNYRSVLETKPSDDYVINHLIECFNIDILSNLAFGLESDALRNNNTEFQQMIQQHLGHFNLWKFYFALHFPNIARLFNFRTNNQKISDYFVRLTNEKIQAREWYSHLQEPNDFLSLFVELRRHKENNDKLNNEKIAAQLFNFISIGLPAFNSILTFCLHELALNADVQAKAYREIKDVLSKNKGNLSIKCLTKMKYLKCIINETLRKYPPYPVLLRNTRNDYEIPDSTFMFKADNQILIPVHALQNDAAIYLEPHQFKPERFLKDNSKTCQYQLLPWLPFGVGPRNCIAQYFAETQLLLGLVTLIRLFKITPTVETKNSLHYDAKSLLLKPNEDVKLHLQHRLSVKFTKSVEEFDKQRQTTRALSEQNDDIFKT